MILLKYIIRFTENDESSQSYRVGRSKTDNFKNTICKITVEKNATHTSPKSKHEKSELDEQYYCKKVRIVFNTEPTIITIFTKLCQTIRYEKCRHVFSNFSYNRISHNNMCEDGYREVFYVCAYLKLKKKKKNTHVKRSVLVTRLTLRHTRNRIVRDFETELNLNDS